MHEDTWPILTVVMFIGAVVFSIVVEGWTGPIKLIIELIAILIIMAALLQITSKILFWLRK